MTDNPTRDQCPPGSGHHEPARIATRHEELRHDSDDKSRHDPAYGPHGRSVEIR